MSNKPLFVVMSDTHLKESNLILVQDIFVQAVKLCKELSINNLIHCGDWFNARDAQSLECLLMSVNILDYLEENNINLFIIAGNHDKKSLISEKSYLSIISKNREYVRLFENEDFVSFGKIILCFLGFFKEGIEYLSRLDNLIQELQSSGFRDHKKVLITHTSINGVINNDGSFVEGDIQSNYFDYFDLILTGHYHTRSQISESIFYIGSSYQANFGENEEKGFAVLYDDLSIEYKQSKFSKYVRIYVEVEVESDLKELFTQLQDHIKYNNSVGNIVQIVFKGGQDKLSTIDLRDPLFKGVEVKCESDETEVLFDKIEDAEMVIFDKKNIAQGWKDYAEKRNIDSIKVHKGLIMLTTSRIQ
jgi:exonuclease SbcD